MGKFAFKAIDSAGAESFGILEANTEADAVKEVGRQGLYVLEVRPASIIDEQRYRWRSQREELERQEAKRQEQLKKRQTRQRLVVRYLDGKTEYGVCFALNPKESMFHLDKVDSEGVTTGKTVQVRYADLKAVFYVKSFDGNYDKSLRYREWIAEGNELIIEFNDGEILRGSSLLHYDPDEPRFHVIPADPTTNNISALVERSAVKRIYTPEEWKERKIEEAQARKSEDSVSDLSQEETTGDFYFETRNYTGALDQYRLAAKKFPQSKRIRRKMLAAQFNIGVQHIKRREYEAALECMQKVLHVEPHNTHAQKKVAQLQKIIERGQKPGPRPPVPDDF